MIDVRMNRKAPMTATRTGGWSACDNRRRCRQVVWCLLGVGLLADPLPAEEVVPNCPCRLNAPGVPWNCSVDSGQCWYLGHGAFYLTFEGLIQIDETILLGCENCTCGSGDLECGNEMCVTSTEEGTVSYSGSLSLEASGHLNVFLAGGIDIATTVEFQAGHTRTTSVSTEICNSCTTTVVECDTLILALESYKQERRGRTPLYYEWSYTVDCFPGDPFTASSSCTGVYATIDGFDAWGAWCDISNAPPCGVCAGCPEPSPHRAP